MPSPISVLRSTLRRAGGGDNSVGLLVSVGGLALALVCAVLGWEIGALVLVFASVLGELVLEPRSPAADKALRQASVAGPVRWLLRLLVVIVAGEHFNTVWSMRTTLLVGLVLLLVLCGRVLHQEYRRVGPLRPMRTRNIPHSPRIDVGPPNRVVLIVLAQLLCLVPGPLHAPWWVVLPLGLIGIALLAAATLPDVKKSLAMRQAKRATGFTGPLRELQTFLDDYQPEVLVHLSGPETAAYQINTWLEALEHLDRRVFIILRDAKLMEKLGSTSIPTLELSNAGELLMLDFGSARVSLFPSNTGNNIHLLRLPNVMSAFVGHGDSDKSASNNPFSRVYDELWVAGQAGADRYRKSGLNVHESLYRFVGRPQVHAIQRADALPSDIVPTVLYAPTWEGVNLDQEYSSVSAVGEKIVRGLLDSEQPIRIAFKAHPFTGQRDAKYRAVVAKISRILDQAASETGVDHRVIKGGPIDEWYNRSHALITDVSSVVSDFLASEKPYAVFNHTDGSAEQFQDDYPSTGAATIIGRDGSGIAEFAAVVTGEAPDTHAEQRSALATYLLGTPDQRTLDAFAASVDALIARSDVERARYRGRSMAQAPVIEEAAAEETDADE